MESNQKIGLTWANLIFFPCFLFLVLQFSTHESVFELIFELLPLTF